jgi:hypothetical protein
MHRRLIERFSAIAVGAVLLASVFGICTRMVAGSAFGCTGDGQHMTAAAPVSIHPGDCATADACPIVASEQSHMMDFASAYPSIQTDGLILLLIGAVTALTVLAWTLRNDPGVIERSRVKMRSLVHSRSRSCTPLFLVFAFQKGILHPKIYA